jgi:hypothetical protein
MRRSHQHHTLAALAVAALAVLAWLALGPAAEAQNYPQRPAYNQPAAQSGSIDSEELFARNLGIYYERVPNADGTFGARLTRPPAPGSPASYTGLEPGDVLVALNGMSFREPSDLMNHKGRTTMTLIDVRTGQWHTANVVIQRRPTDNRQAALPYPQRPTDNRQAGQNGPIKSGQYCSYDGTISGDELARYHYLNFSDNAPAEQVTQEVVAAVGVPGRSITVRAGNVPNAVALVDRAIRIIVYNPGFLQGAKTQTGTNWAVYCVMAHEIGHHLIGHTLERGGSQPDKEEEADKFSGYVLFLLGATVEQAESGLRSLPDEGGSATHPPKEVRLRAVVAGWNEAKSRADSKPNGAETRPKTGPSTIPPFPGLPPFPGEGMPVPSTIPGGGMPAPSTIPPFPGLPPFPGGDMPPFPGLPPFPGGGMPPPTAFPPFPGLPPFPGGAMPGPPAFPGLPPFPGGGMPPPTAFLPFPGAGMPAPPAFPGRAMPAHPTFPRNLVARGGMPLRGPSDFLNHTGPTTMTLIDVRAGQPHTANLLLR